VLNVVKATEMLEFIDTPKRWAVLEPLGRQFLQASPDDRKSLWRGQLLKLHLFQQVRDVLLRQPEQVVERDFVLETIIVRMPQENYETVFNTFIRWARFGSLFSYDETTELMSLG